MLIAENAYKLDCTRGSYAYVVKEEGGATLIDTGFPGRGRAILRELASLGIAPRDVKRILLTHSDGDHIANAGYLADKTGCEVFIGAKDLPVALRRQKAVGLKRFVSVFMRAALPASARALPDGAIGPLQIISTPGHTPGHTCYRYRDVLFAGDLVRSGSGGFISSPALFTEDRAGAVASVTALDVSGIDWICPAHGEPLKASPAWQAFVGRMTP